MKKHLIDIVYSPYNVELHFDSHATKQTIYTYAYKYALSNNLFVLTYRVNRGLQIVTLVNY
ncbi:hypothetical protein MCETHM1_01648 [Flavobacteriaceae bacterium]